MTSYQISAKMSGESKTTAELPMVVDRWYQTDRQHYDSIYCLAYDAL